MEQFESFAQSLKKLIERIENGEFDEETVKRLEYITGKGLKLHKMIEKVHNGEDLTSEEINLYLDSLGNDEVIDKYLKPPSVL